MLTFARRSTTALGLPKICVAILLLALAAVGQARVQGETHDVLQFDYYQTGANEEEAVRLACIRAVHATVGRVLFSDFGLQARDLLGPYIQKNWQEFTASFYVLERRFERDGFGTRIRVQTFPEKLTRDLREKRFLFMPPVHPYHYVFLAESIDGNPAPTDLGRVEILNRLADEGLKVYAEGIESPTNNSDVLSDPAFLSAAQAAATKLGAHVIVVGRAMTRSVAQEEIYYDPITTFETDLHLQMIRVDDGRVLASTDITARGSDTDVSQAYREATAAAARDGINNLIVASRNAWRKTALDAPRFSLMFTDLTHDEAESMARYLQSTLSHGTQVHLKDWFGNVAILNVDTDRAYAALERAIIDFKQYDLRIVDRQGKRITVDVKH